MMKKHLILLSILALCLGSCNKADDIFDKSPSERIEESMREYNELLKSNTNGWVVQYYPRKGMKYGGFNLYFKFDEKDKVSVGSDVSDAALEESLYSIKGDMGPTLNFDTYNEKLNYFSDPALDVGDGTGYGYEGDYEFVLISGSAKEIVLRGKKTKNLMRMFPLPEGETWAQYITKTKDVVDNGLGAVYTLKVNDEAYPITRSNNVFTITNGENEIIAPYTFTPEGLYLNAPLTIADQTFQEFTLNKATYTYSSQNDKVVIQIVVTNINEVFSTTSTQYFFDEASLSSSMKTLWYSANASLTASEGEHIIWGYLGQSHHPGHTGKALVFAPGVTTYYTAGYKFTFTAVVDSADQVEVKYDNGTFADGGYVNYSSAFMPIVNLISNNSPYKLTPDNALNPSVIKFEGVSDPTVYFSIEL